MGSRVESPGALHESECRDDLLGEPALKIRVEVTVEERGVDVRCCADELRQRRAQRREDLADLGRGHSRLVVVEQRGVGLVGGIEAGDVSPLQLHVLAQVGQEGGEVVGGAGLDPGMVAARCGAGHLDPQLGGDAAGLRPVAAGDADQAGVVGVVGKRFLEWCEPVEQPTDLGVGEPVVDDPAESGERIGPRCRSQWRHRHALLPAEHTGRPAEVGDLGKSFA